MKNSDKKNVLYIVPNIKKITGGPVSRVSDFKIVFEKNDDIVIENNKIIKSLTIKKINIVYVETASNRISLSDFFSLLVLKVRSKKMIIFIRDVYIELFPEEYKGFRKTITFYSNKISNLFLSIVADQMAFPTFQMGKIFFEKNSLFPERPHFALPPATSNLEIGDASLIDFSKKIGILFLGGTQYVNSGIEKFIQLSQHLGNNYNFYILTPDTDLDKRFNLPKNLKIQYVRRDEINDFIIKNNIGVAYHTRPRNFYDDITFPIKVLDFLNFQIPFLSEKHIPLESLMGKDYDLYVDWEKLDDIINKTEHATNSRHEHLKKLREIAENNTYENRYVEITSK